MCSSLMISDTKHLFISLLAIGMSSLEKMGPLTMFYQVGWFFALIAVSWPLVFKYMRI